MGIISSAMRKKLPSQDFGLPGKKAYPLPDASHAANSKARATQMVNKGKLSESAKQKIDAKANKVIAKGKKK